MTTYYFFIDLFYMKEPENVSNIAYKAEKSKTMYVVKSKSKVNE